MLQSRQSYITMLIIGLLITISCNTWSQSPAYSTSTTTIYGLPVTSTYLSLDTTDIGVLRSVKLPLLSWYVLFDFYINKEHRQHGYGKQLFKHVLDELVTKKSATKILLNPGPFEKKDDTFAPVHGPERAELLQKLIKFYQSFNFRFMNNRYLATVLKACYKVAGIHEDPHLLMVYNKENHHAK